MSLLIKIYLENDLVGVRALLQKGEDVEENRRICCEAILWCKPHQPDFEEWVMMFMEHGAVLKTIYNEGIFRQEDGQEMYHRAVSSSLFHLRVLQLCEQHGLDINARDRHQHTPLNIACCFRNVKGVEWLLSKGADVNARDESGATILDIVVDPDSNSINPDIFFMLLKHGAERGGSVGILPSVLGVIRSLKVILTLVSVHRVPRLCKGGIRSLPPELLRILAGFNDTFLAND